MPFIKRLIPLTLAAMLAACSNLPQPTQAPPVEPETPAPEEGVVFTPVPNPYLGSQRNLSDQVLAIFMDAQQAMEAEKWQQAQALLEQMTQNHPDLSGPFVNLGLIYRQQGDPERAAQAFRQAIAVNSLNGEAYNQLAILHRERGEFAEAEKLYLKALDVWPHNPVVHRNLGILYDLYMGRLSEALQHYKMSQKVISEPERKVEGWIVDLERRIAEQQTTAQSQ